MGRKKKNKMYQKRMRKLEEQRIQALIDANNENILNNTWDIIDIIEFSKSIENSSKCDQTKPNKNLYDYIVSSLYLRKWSTTNSKSSSSEDKKFNTMRS